MGWFEAVRASLVYVTVMRQVESLFICSIEESRYCSVIGKITESSALQIKKAGTPSRNQTAAYETIDADMMCLHLESATLPVEPQEEQKRTVD